MNVTVYRLSVMLRRQSRMTRMSRLFQKPEIRNTLEHFIENIVIEHVKEPLPKTQGLNSFAFAGVSTQSANQSSTC